MVIDDEGGDPYMHIHASDEERLAPRRSNQRAITEKDKVAIRAVYNEAPHRHPDDICQKLADVYGLEVTVAQVMAVVAEAAPSGPARVTFRSPSDRRSPGR